MSLKGFFPLSSCLLAREERMLCPVVPWPCWSDMGAGLGFSSYSAQTCQTQGDWHPSPHQDTLLGHPQVATVSCFSTACPALQSWILARQCQPIFSDPYPAVGCPSTSLQNPTVIWQTGKAACGWLAPGSLALQEEGGRLSYTILQ